MCVVGINSLYGFLNELKLNFFKYTVLREFYSVTKETQVDPLDFQPMPTTPFQAEDLHPSINPNQ
jgi:hypothetical protein